MPITNLCCPDCGDKWQANIDARQREVMCFTCKRWVPRRSTGRRGAHSNEHRTGGDAGAGVISTRHDRNVSNGSLFTNDGDDRPIDRSPTNE